MSIIVLGDPVQVWFGSHEGTAGSLAAIGGDRHGCIVAIVRKENGKHIRVPAAYCDPNPARLYPREDVA